MCRNLQQKNINIFKMHLLPVVLQLPSQIDHYTHASHKKVDVKLLYTKHYTTKLVHSKKKRNSTHTSIKIERKRLRQ